MMEKTLVKGSFMGRHGSVEQGDVVIVNNQGYLVAQIDAGKHKLISLSSDTGNRLTDMALERGATISKALQNTCHEDSTDVIVVKKGHYQLNLIY